MYFNSFPNFVYPLSDTQKIVTKDIFRRVGLKKNVVSEFRLDSYYITAGDSPDVVAAKLYGNPNYHWILLITNNIVNPYEEWPLGEQELIAYVIKKYQVGDKTETEALTDIHHCEIENSDPPIIVQSIVQSGVVACRDGDKAVTNYEHEYLLNRQKCQIKILRPEYVGEFILQYKKLVESQ